MPGLTVIRGRDALDDAAVDAALDAVCFFDTYDRERLYEDGEHLVVSTAYPDYPVQRVETDGGPVVLEGDLYDVSEAALPSTLRRVGRWAAAGDDRSLGSWLG